MRGCTFDITHHLLFSSLILFSIQYRTPDVNAAAVSHIPANPMCRLINRPVQPNDSSSTVCMSGSSHTQNSKNISSSMSASKKQQHHGNGSGPSGSSNSHPVIPLATSVSSPNLHNASAVFSSGSNSESEVRLGTAAYGSPIMCENNE
jgi:hypothetical protein